MPDFKKELTNSIWSTDKYYEIAGKASKDTKHLGMVMLRKYAPGSRQILDLGCGEGTRLSCFLDLKIPLYGIDISRKGINFAKKKYPKINFLQGDLENLPYKDKNFDLVYSAWVLEHLSNPEKMIIEAIRVTNRNGYLVLIAPNFGAPNRVSPPSKEQRTKKILWGLFKDFILLFKNIQHLDWIFIKPIANKTKYDIDWDTTVEPYILTLKKYLIFKKLEIKDYSSCFEEESQNLSIIQRLIKVLASMRVYPFYYWGPHIVIVAKKII